MDGLLQNALAVEAATVIFDTNPDLVAFVERFEVDPAALRLAGLHPGCRLLDAMINGVPQDMDQRIGDRLDHIAVHLRVPTGDDQVSLLV